MIAATIAATETATTTAEDAAEAEVAPVLLPATIGPVMTAIAGTVETVVTETTAVARVTLVATAVKMAVLTLATRPRRLSQPRTSVTVEPSFASSLRTDSEAPN